jgi:hypothetical protein
MKDSRLIRAPYPHATADTTPEASILSLVESTMRAIPMVMITFQPDDSTPDNPGRLETGLFIGVRADPALESTQLRWQVKVSPPDSVALETGQYLERLGGALFLTTREPRPDTTPGEEPATIGWILWIADEGRRSYQIQLAISRVGFDRVCELARKGRYPHAILTFKDEDRMDLGQGSDGTRKVWKNLITKVAPIAEFTLRYDFSRPEEPDGKD